MGNAATSSDCPTRDRLAALLDGKLPESDQSLLSAHLGNCSACQDVLERMARGSQFGMSSESATATVANGSGGSFAAPADPLIGQKIGQYHIKSLIGSGGMGYVYLALQQRPHRTVAFKIMKQGIASRSALRRFEYEAQILARLRHQGIAQIYEAGTHTDPMAGPGPGVPYFAMEYVPNAKGIMEFAADRQLDVGARLELFAQVCEAIHHGHQKGIIHRDLKPSNILVDSAGQAKIIDFGVARATDSDLAVTTLQTDIGQLVGTLQYMSPEQYEADPTDLDTRSDVYALGVVLYELLCEQLPYDVSKVSVYHAARVIREADPPRLSSINRSLRGDLETIARKALEKDRDRRYESSSELARDIRRYLNHEPIEARPPSILYHFAKFVRRNRAVVIGAAGVFVTLLVGAVGTTWQATRATEAERNVAKAEEDKVKQTEGTTQGMLALRQDGLRSRYRLSLSSAQVAMVRGTFRVAQEDLVGCPRDLRDWHWRRLDWMAGHLVQTGSSDGMATTAVPAGQGFDHYQFGTQVLAISEDGTLQTGGFDGTIQIWDPQSNKLVGQCVGHESGVSSLLAAADGLISASHDHTIRLWDRYGAQQRVLIGHESAVYCLAVDPYGQRLVSGSSTISLGSPHRIRLWDLTTGQEVLQVEGDRDDWAVSCLAFDRLGKRIACGGFSGTVQILDARVGDVLANLAREDGPAHRGRVTGLAFVGNRIITAGNDGELRLWDAATGQPVGTWGPEAATRPPAITALALSPDRKRIAVGAADGQIRVWDLSSAAVQIHDSDGVERFGPHAISCLAWTPDSQSVVWSRFDGWIGRWTPGSGAVAAQGE